MRTICNCSSCRGLPIRLHCTASGSSMKRAEWKVRIVRWPATPGATTFRPPDEAGGDAQIGLHQQAVDADRCSARAGLAQVDMVLFVARVMVLDAHMLHHP